MKPMPQIVLTLVLVWGSIYVYAGFLSDGREQAGARAPADSDAPPSAGRAPTAEPETIEPVNPPAPSPGPVEPEDDDGGFSDAEIARFTALLDVAEQAEAVADGFSGRGGGPAGAFGGRRER